MPHHPPRVIGGDELVVFVRVSVKERIRVMRLGRLRRIGDRERNHDRRNPQDVGRIDPDNRFGLGVVLEEHHENYVERAQRTKASVPQLVLKFDLFLLSASVSRPHPSPVRPMSGTASHK
mgnify:CR=1 FL=1